MKRAPQCRFGQQILADDARDKLVSHCRSEGESMGAYAASLCHYTQRGYPTFNQRRKTQHELALQVFIQGLQSDLTEHNPGR